MTDFNKAIAIWPKGREEEWNRMVGFFASIELDTLPSDAMLRITGADCYRIKVNGQFVGHGPARGPHGYIRVDHWPLENYLKEGLNHLSIEVLTNGVDSYAFVMQSPFLRAECCVGEDVVAWTGEHFQAQLLPERIQKVERFSKQRPFAEAYRLSPDANAWQRGEAEVKGEECVEVPCPQLLPRHVPLTGTDCIPPKARIAEGRVEEMSPPRPPVKHAARDGVGKRVRGFPVKDLEIDMRVEINAMSFVENDVDISPADVCKVSASGHALYDFGIIQGGFVGARLNASAATRVYLMFEEVRDRRLFALGLGAIALDLEPGTHHFESIDPYTFQYLRVISLNAEVTVEEVYVREFANPTAELRGLENLDEELALIARASLQTFRTNAIDLYTDCMSRERGGYPCDSWFTGRAEKVLCGESIVERNFLENYFLAGSFSSIPEGMFPHCYPSDRLGQGQYIPNWALWLVLQLCRYCDDTGDTSLMEVARPRVEALFKWFEPCLNEENLLEDIPGWIFVEWSPANDSTHAVNHPTNMLYAACLEATGQTFGRDDWSSQAAKVKKAVLKESWDGTFFYDQSIRVDGQLTRGEVRTETCQYHAFSFGVANGPEFEDLWCRLRDHWGPSRGMHMTMEPGVSGWKLYYDEGSGPRPDDGDLAPAGLLFGLMLRFDLLQEREEWDLLLSEVKKLFGPMAKQSGTLWEHVEDHASLNHGFASCAIEYIRNATEAKS